MAISHFIVAGIVGAYSDNWPEHRAAGWVAVVFVWFYAIHFGYSWGPVAWIIISEVYPLGMRAKGVSIGGSSNWLNNFAVAVSTSPFIEASQFGAFVSLIRTFSQSPSSNRTCRSSSGQSQQLASSGSISL